MPYLNVDLDYFDHRKTKRLIGLLGRGAEILPLRLWAYCGKFHCEDGRLAGYSEQEIESIASWWGQGGLMLPAMEKAAWMGQDGATWFMVAWVEHQGHLAAFKAKGKAMADARWSKAREDASSIAVSIAKKPPKQCPIRSDPTVPTKPTDLSKKVGFVKPTFAEMELHASKIGLPPTEITGFFNHHEARGWKYRGGQRMVSWQAAMVTWKENGKKFGTTKPDRDYSKF